MTTASTRRTSRNPRIVQAIVAAWLAWGWPTATRAADDTAPAETTATAGAPEEKALQFSGIPAINYISDNGLGLGFIIAGYWRDGTLPYRAALTLQVFATTRLVQDHSLVGDVLLVGGLPLRLTGRVGFIASLTQNYCGLGGTVTCDAVEARQAADARGMARGTARDHFVDTYYQRRIINPYGLLNARYLIAAATQHTPKAEVTAGYRGFALMPGNLFADDDHDGAPDLFPYPGSRYAQDYPRGEPGFDSVVSIGLMLDSRDNEPAPTRGIFAEASLRASSPLFLSTWTWAGAHFTIRSFVPLRIVPQLGDRVVLANRLSLDGIVGDIPIQELSRLGGSQDVYAFGGADIGRGIRVQRYLGKGKVIDQAELRYRFFETQVFEQNFAFTTALFVDAAIIADEVVAPTNIGSVWGAGGALRVAWNENFVVRADLGFSPVEDFAPQLYITINQPF